MRALIVEDDVSTSKIIEMIMRNEDFAVDAVDLGSDGLQVGKLYDYDIIVVDLMLPDMNGVEVIKKLRASSVKTPILVLSGLSDVRDKIKCFNAGADDYLTKPFDKSELIARINAVIRRSKGHADSVIRTGRLTLSLQKKIAEVDGCPLDLTGKEYAILELLCMRKGSTLTKEVFLNHLYGGMDEPELKIIDVFVCKLRKKLSQALGGVNYIATVWGRGYMLVDPKASSEINVCGLEHEMQAETEGYSQPSNVSSIDVHGNRVINR